VPSDVPTPTAEPLRCEWAGSDPLMVAYHDDEWGVPVRDETRLFEMLCLEGAQAGLSWSTILRRREGYRAVYEGFDAGRIAAWDDARQATVLQDPRIVRNRAKVHAFRENARAVLRLRADEGGLAPWLWGQVGGRPIVGRHRRLSDIPARTPLSERLSRDLARRGFRFVGPVIVYAWLQSVGVVNDHVLDCFRHPARG
jgi:DNA-3-methyladenine glycosylase I